MLCRHFMKPALSRREMLARCAHGFGGLALTALLADPSFAGSTTYSSWGKNPMRPRSGHHKARAKNVIFLFMSGGPSQVDTFDPKPQLAAENGQPIKMKVPPTQFNTIGNVMKSPWGFKNYGESGVPVSDLFPHIATCVDDMAIIRSMVSNFPEHSAANYFMHSGRSQQGWPSLGAWVTYGLGSESQDLPGFIVLDSGMIPPGGRDIFHSGFLSATYQASFFRQGDHPVANIKRTEEREELQKGKFSLMRQLDEEFLERAGGDDKLEAAIANYELAFRMQGAVPNLMDLRGESKATMELYGLNDKTTETFGRQCLLARRLVERGVRFVELLTSSHEGFGSWDQHTNLEKGHLINAVATDKPIAGLLKDLKSRGLLDDTLVLWGGEFGRTPMAQGTFGGRDHNPYGFSMWMAGGGIKGGTIYGSTDDYGYFAVENKVEVHDLHATILHLLGIDHNRLTYRFSGRDMRLTDVHGEVVHGILA
ncbi:DUF1501 domain-containing protein [Acidobacteria bacterium AH-259-O06]|nr:DUF1501 domain-containing protein [Acidobacteria bacterium AH-259-O06]